MWQNDIIFAPAVTDALRGVFFGWGGREQEVFDKRV